MSWAADIMSSGELDICQFHGGVGGLQCELCAALCVFVCFSTLAACVCAAECHFRG